MKIFLGADHRGYELKEKIASWLFELEVDFEDLGADHLDEGDDYSKYATEVASLVAKRPGSKGVLLCGSGVGVEVMANKFDGIRAAIGKSAGQVKAGREDDDMNVLVIASDFTLERQAKGMLIAFLETKYQKNVRHERRLDEIEKIEANN
ncbi:RpiB/LacA/LacB family sugar-phosphate isomerase [Candidatus Microgenomates bacterium]|nr:RpiB/LacA/LacB family sugar-phosphate isomerase [Candidatus Microgenomates bacterium]